MYFCEEKSNKRIIIVSKSDVIQRRMTDVVNES